MILAPFWGSKNHVVACGMDIGGELARVHALSDGELLSRLSGLLSTSRRMVAEVVAHLGEVEERRLHVLGGYSSLFAYCVARLGMSEDEAYRRIEVARLARRFPLLLERLASGHVSLSVAALLKSHLTSTNCAELLEALSGKTVQQAREVLAAWHPQPDVLPSIRKLPVRHADARTERLRAEPSAVQTGSCRGEAVEAPKDPMAFASHGTSSPAELQRGGPAAPQVAPARRQLASRSIEPLSPERYKVQLTASAELKHKLELARDLLRHAVPSGDLAVILERALDLLIERTMKRRFGASARAKASTGVVRKSAASEESQRPSVDAAHTPPAASKERDPGGASWRGPTAAAPSTGAPSSDVRSPDAPSANVSPSAPLAAALTVSTPSTGTPSPGARSAAALTVSSPSASTPSVSTPSANVSPGAPSAAALTVSSPSTSTPSVSTRSTGTPLPAAMGADLPSNASAPPSRSSKCSRRPTSAARRDVLARDDARCTWQGPDGTRCNSRAWLEHDHVTPWGQGGRSVPANIRLICRAHNRFAAEQAYGRDTIARIVDRRRRSRAASARFGSAAARTAGP